MFLRASKQVTDLCFNAVKAKAPLKFAVVNMSSSNLAPSAVAHDQKNQLFYIDLKDEQAASNDRAVLQYQWVKKGVVDLYHTGVPPSHRGQGIAQLLAKAAFDYVVKTDGKMHLSCTYLQQYLKDNPLPEYQSRVVE